MPVKTNCPDIQILTSLEEIRKYREEWLAFLLQRAHSHSLRQHPDYIRFQIETTGTARPCIVITRVAGEISALAACHLQNTTYHIEFSVFRIRGMKAGILTILGSTVVLAEGADAEQHLEQIFSALLAQVSFDIISLEHLCLTDPLYNFLSSERAARLHLRLHIVSPETEKIRTHILYDTHDQWMASLKGKTRGKIRRKIRSLNKRYPDQVEFRRLNRPDQVKEYLDALNTLFPKTWQAKTFGVTQRNSGEDIRFLTNVARRGWFRSYLLLINNAPAAFLTGLQYNNIFHHSECGYDPAFSRLGVGSVLNYLVLEDLYSFNPPAELDFGFGENEYKRILGTTEQDAVAARISRPGRMRILLRIQDTASRCEQFTRKAVQALGLEKTLRKILKKR